MPMTPKQWEEFIARLRRRQTMQTTADLRRIAREVNALKGEIITSLRMWDALAGQGDRTGLMMSAHLRRMADDLDRIMGNASQVINNELSGSWQVWWDMGTAATTETALAAGMAATDLALTGEKLALYRDYIPDLIKSVADTTKVRMANFIRTASLAGEPRATVQKGMLKILLGEPARYDRGRFGGFAYQVERIFRTESQRLYNMAAQNAAEALTEKTGAQLVKVWNHPGADLTSREDHVEMDGEVAEIDEPFSNGLMFPKDPGGAAEDTINCRCWVSYLPRDVVGGE